jgi:ABC-type lipoprotein export system ATPase subunit
VATHDEAVAAMADRTIQIQDGRLIAASATGAGE